MGADLRDMRNWYFILEENIEFYGSKEYKLSAQNLNQAEMLWIEQEIRNFLAHVQKKDRER